MIVRDNSKPEIFRNHEAENKHNCFAVVYYFIKRQRAVDHIVQKKARAEKVCVPAGHRKVALQRRVGERFDEGRSDVAPVTSVANSLD